jgi:ketosteroid isomerase-like protein
MRSLVIVVLTALLSMPGFAQASATNLQTELQTLHAKWMKAYDNGDGVTMDQMEMDNLVLVMPTGDLWAKTKPRGTSEPKLDPTTQRTLSDVSVRQFGDTAILTGTLTAKSKEENSKAGTTVVFVRNGGRWKIASAQWSAVANPK